ncbi:hypothetical protein UVI_02038920 [Ustilaginoidea virens]|uniref:Nucleoporin NUP49/NSP49 n=1 Tax=Ustilaginoidea virens TaxID=1159556 RepID=A0A1B5L1Q9_USTVR|nr:hypothetical protein UVI_02038920 [Ustilaginoidea virens]
MSELIFRVERRCGYCGSSWFKIRNGPTSPRGLMAEHYFGSQGTPASPASSATGAMATTGGLFGSTQPKTGTGLFGSSTTAATGPTGQTGTTGGLFGGISSSQPTQQSSINTGTGLFGAASTQTQTQPAPSGGLFGGNPTTQQQQQQPQPQPQQTGGGLFGASTANTQAAAPTAGGMFGQSQATTSGGLFVQTQPQQAQTTAQVVPAVQINYDNLRPRTRFEELAKPVQDEIALIDKGIQRVIKMKDEIGEFMPQHRRDIEQLGRDVKFVESKFRTAQAALNGDIQTVKVLQGMTKKNISDAQLSFKATDNLKLPTHYHQTGLFAAHANAQDLITYFNRVCDDVEKHKKRLDDYRAEIERDMPGVENGLYEQIRNLRDRNAASAGAVQDQLGQILSALREMGNAIIAQAGQIADTRERLSRLQVGILDSDAYATGMTG